jgi:hypothetical protein
MRSCVRLAFVAFGLFVLVSCSGTTTGSGIDTGSGELACAKGEVHIAGQMGGTQIDQRWPFKGIILNQASNPKNASITFGSGGQISLQWDGLLANGQSAPAKGSILLPDGPLAGTNYCLGDGSTVKLLESAGELRLRGATKGTSCPGSAIDGELEGCWAKP